MCLDSLRIVTGQVTCVGLDPRREALREHVQPAERQRHTKATALSCHTRAHSGPPRPNSEESIKTIIHLQLSVPDGRDGLDELIRKVSLLASITPGAEAEIREMGWEYCSGNFGKTLGVDHPSVPGWEVRNKDSSDVFRGVW